jgi:7-cyano-7-deazaguanine synthase
LIEIGSKMINDKALVLFSGGQDSATCLAWALSNFASVETVGYHYGQRHAIEMDVRITFLDKFKAMFPRWKSKMGEDFVLNLPVLGEISETSLTRESEINFSDKGLPTTFVPARNLVFLTLAAALAVRRGAKHIILGVCETDYSGYPDCRDDTIKAMQVALNLGLDERLVLHTPLMWLDKCDTWRSAEELGGLKFVKLIEEETHTCYFGERGVRHDWGYGCATCPSCNLRKMGYSKYRGV